MTRPLPQLPLSPTTLSAVQATALVLLRDDDGTMVSTDPVVAWDNVMIAINGVRGALDRDEERSELVRHILDIAATACLWVEALEGPAGR